MLKQNYIAMLNRILQFHYFTRIGIIGFLIFTSFLSFAQDKSVSGRVIGENDVALSGVSINVKGSSKGTITDNDGRFTLQVGRNSILIFSSVGYDTKEANVSNLKNNLNIQMVAKSDVLGEVVVVGYGSQSKRNLATSSSTVSAKQFQTAVINTVDQALQGRTTGTQVTVSSGEPGASAVIRIRGSNSLVGNNDPLFVIDGFPMPPYIEATASVYGSYAQNGLYGLNPNDIESMVVLKDASATAIYGSRGANGVILITTKSGKKGEGKIEIVNKTSVGSTANPVEMMSGKQFAETYNELAVLVGNPKPYGNIDTLTTNTNWYDAMTRPSKRQDISLNVSGGNEKSSYYLSGNYLKDEGIVLGSDVTRASLRGNFNGEVNKWYTFKSQLSFSHQNSNRGISSNGGWPNGFGLMENLRVNPLYKIDQPSIGIGLIPGFGGEFFQNPVFAQLEKKDVSVNDYSIINVENIFRLDSNLTFTVTLGQIQNLTRRKAFFPVTVAEGFYSGGSGSNSLANTYSYSANAFLRYNRTFWENHKVSLTLGSEYSKTVVETLTESGTGFNFPSFGVNNFSSALSQQAASFREDRIIESGFFRANYMFKGKYVLNTSIRLDAASPFAENKKSGYFPSISAAWNLNEEAFMKNVNFIANTKIRASYGITGSQALAPYSSLARYGNYFYQLGGSAFAVVYPLTLGNADLSWERTKQYNGGIDFSTFNNKLTISFDYYDKKTIGLLQPRLLPSQSGFSSITDNYGTIGNKGIELGLEVNLIKRKNIQFTSRLNISKNKNVLIDLGTRTSPTFISIGGNLQDGVFGILVPGQAIGQFYGYKVTGLTQLKDFTNGSPNYPFPGAIGDQRPGNWKYEDLNNDNKINANDRQLLGNSNPDFVYGWNNDFTWKRISVNIFFVGSVGNDILDLTRYYIGNGLIMNTLGHPFNQAEEWYQNRWTIDNQHNNPLYPGIQSNAATTDINSTMIENGSYLRLKQFSLSYSFPAMNIVKNLRLFVTGTNLFTITKYRGFDPEVGTAGSNILRQGIDYGAYPSQQSYTIGLSCNF